MVPVFQDFFQCMLQFFPGLRELHADGTSAVDDFHRTGDRKRLGQTRNVLFLINDLLPGRRAYAARHQDALCHCLVHGQSARERAGTRIRYSGHFKNRLNLAVFAVLSVQAEKHAVGHGADLDHVFPETACALFLPAVPYFLQIRGLGPDFDRPAKPVRFGKSLFQGLVIILHAEKHIHIDRLVTAAAQCLTDRSRRNLGNIPFRADAPA